MNKLLDFFKRSRNETADSRNFSFAPETKVETHNQEAQGIGKKFITKGKSNFNLDYSTKNITINLNLQTIPSDPKERAELASLIRESFNNGEACLISQSAVEDVQDYNQNPIEESMELALEYMATIAPEYDLLCMRTGLYIRNLDGRGETERAKQVRDRASRTSRARNIVNLASAGFIEGYVVPVCEASGENAKRVYNDIVEDLPGIVFVNAAMDVSKTMKIIEKKMNDRVKYHWEITSISVNGLNSCIDTIMDVRDELAKRYPDLKTSLLKTDELNFSRAELKIHLENAGV